MDPRNVQTPHPQCVRPSVEYDTIPSTSDNSPVCHRGAHRMVSQYRPPMPEGLLGVQNTAVAEWKTEILLTFSVLGQSKREGAH